MKSSESEVDTGKIKSDVTAALKEDVGSGDLTAGLLSKDTEVTAILYCRTEAVLCGTAWFNEVFSQLDANIKITWNFKDGDSLPENSKVCSLSGSAVNILTGERSALNFLQTLSGTATRTKQYVDAVDGTEVKILDTRKTIPGFRLAQKYAVKCGGGENHRLGLFDAILIKENHIHAAGSIQAALKSAQKLIDRVRFIEIEVENISELEQAVAAGAKRILIDNFSHDDIKQAVKITRGKSEIEASGGIELENIQAIASTGVNYISVGDITKNLTATDFSLIISDTASTKD